ncbi:MAG: hypothetical protein MPJ50_05430 [Pirellulales bacterium]|nr:hypothetical protein [Pirellulales bacterium]
MPSESPQAKDLSTSSQQSSAVRTRRTRKLQLSLRALLVGVSAVAIFLGFWKWGIQPYRLNDRLKSYIESSGGSYRMEDGPFWIEWFTGDDYGAYVTEIDLSSSLTVVRDNPRSNQCLFCELGQFSKLRVLRLRNQPVTDECLSALKGLEHLEILDLEGTAITTTKGWEAWPLRELNVSQTPLDDDGLSGISQFKDLRVLKVNSTCLRDEDLKMFKSLRQLRTFEGSNGRVTHLGWQQLDDFSIECSVIIDGWQFFDVALSEPDHRRSFDSESYGGIQAMLSSMPSPEMLTAQARSSLQRNVKAVPPLDGEGTLLKAVSGFQYLHMDAIGLQQNIVTLGLDSPYVGDEQLECLAQFPSLEELDLSDSWITDQGLAKLQMCQGLTQLDLSDTRISDAGLPQLKELSQLQSLVLSGTRVSPDGIASLRSLPHLEDLGIPRNAFRGSALDTILRMPALRTLSMRRVGKWDVESRVMPQVTESDVRKIQDIGDMLFDRNDLDGDGVISADENGLIALFYGSPSRAELKAELLALVHLPSTDKQLIPSDVEALMKKLIAEGGYLTRRSGASSY